MIGKKSYLAQLDFFGLAVSLLCAFHCLALPLIITIGGLGGLHILESSLLEGFIIFLSLLLALSSLLPSFWNKHSNPIPLIWMGTGFSLLLLTHFLFPESWESFTTSSAAVLIAFAHYKNWRLLKNKPKKAQN